MSQIQTIAVIVFSIVAIAILGVVRWRHREFSIPQLILWYLANFLVRFLWRAKQPRRWPLPSGQGVVVICNHRSSVDPFFIQTIAEEPMRWMVAKEYVQHWSLKWFLQTCNV